MKRSTTILTIAFSLFFVFAQAQDLDPAAVKKMVDSQKFVFVAETMVPSGGNSRNLDYRYDVKVSDTLVTYLPYIGRAYTAILPNEAGVNFTSTSFDYKSKFKKKKWEVSIRTKDVKDMKEMHFTIFDNGRATLNLIPSNKQAIIYYGYLAKG